MRAWAAIALFSASLTGLATANFAGLTPVPPVEDVRFAEMLGAPAGGGSARHNPATAMQVAFSQDGQRVIARHRDGRVLEWDRSSGEARLLAHTTGAFAYCAGEHRLVVSDRTGAVALSLQDGRFEHLAASPQDHAAFSADCGAIALANADEPTVRLLRSGAEPEELSTMRPVRDGLSLSRDGRHLAVAVAAAEGEAWAQTGLEIFDLKAAGRATNMVTGGEVAAGQGALEFEAAGHGLFLGSQVLGQGGLRRVDAASGDIVWGYEGTDTKWVRGLAAGPEGAYLASGDDSGWLKLWDAEAGVLLTERHAGQTIQALAFSPDGGLIAVAMEDGTIGIAPLGAMF